MAKTVLSDVIVPSVFNPYVRERSIHRNRLIQCGAVGIDDEFNRLASGPGKTIDLPFFKDLTGSSSVISDSASLTPDKITTGQDTAAKNVRGKAWSANLLTKWLSGDDPVARIGDAEADWWNRDHQTTLLAQLTGLFDSTSGVLRNTHRLNIYSDVAAGSITDAMRLTGATFIDALQKLGDHSLEIVLAVMHSDVEASLRKRDLITFLPDSTGKAVIERFHSREFLVDDAMPKVAGTNSPAYTTYLFGRDAFAFGIGDMDDKEEHELYRDALASDWGFVARRQFIIHPRGCRWIGTPAGASPTDAEYATPANWSKVYQDKNIRIIAVRHNV